MHDEKQAECCVEGTRQDCMKLGRIERVLSCKDCFTVEKSLIVCMFIEGAIPRYELGRFKFPVF